MAAWAQAIATVIAALVGGFVSYFLLAQQRAKIHEKRLDAYARLWELTEEFRLNGPPIDSQRRQQLANELTKWYFQPGGGMLLTGRTLAMFIKVRANLTCDPPVFAPSSWKTLLRSPNQDQQACDQRRFLLLQRQFSLLRTQLKNDCAIYYGRHMSTDFAQPGRLYKPYDLDFLNECDLQKVGIWKQAAKNALDIDEEGYIERLKTRYQGTPGISVRQRSTVQPRPA